MNELTQKNTPVPRFKGSELTLNKTNIIKSIIASILFVYKNKHQKNNEVVILGELNGNLHLFELKLDNNKYCLIYKDSYKALTKKLFNEGEEHDAIWENDFAIQMIKSHDHKFVFIRTLMSKIIILKINYNSMKFEIIKVFEEIYNFKEMRLTPDGKNLIVGGDLVSSYMSIDLSDIDKESFGEGNEDYLKVLDHFSQFENKNEIIDQNDLKKHLIIYFYGSKDNYDELLEERANANARLLEENERLRDEELIDDKKIEINGSNESISDTSSDEDNDESENENNNVNDDDNISSDYVTEPDSDSDPE